jgi:hypothetical protein
MMSDHSCITAHPSITGWKTAPRASGADDAASVLFSDSGGIMLSGVAELSVFSMQMEIRPKGTLPRGCWLNRLALLWLEDAPECLNALF